jgi:hypothetical protein
MPLIGLELNMYMERDMAEGKGSNWAFAVLAIGFFIVALVPELRTIAVGIGVIVGVIHMLKKKALGE